MPAISRASETESDFAFIGFTFIDLDIEDLDIGSPFEVGVGV
jgi:hypothetical protein